MAMTYDEALRRLGRRVGVKIDKVRGTEMRRASGERGDHGDVEVRYRGTPVVTLHPDHTYTLRTGGTYSKTTIRRIAEYSPVQLTRERNGIFIHDEARGKWIPFLEGMRVDRAGRRVDVAPDLKMLVPRASDTEGERNISFKSEQALIAFIRETVMEVVSDLALAPGRTMGVTRPEGRKTVDVKIRAAKIETPDQPMIPLDVVEKLFHSKMSPDKANRAVRELYESFARGRKPTKGRADDEGEAPRTAEAARCADCREPLANHYDRANRYKGCDYALKHAGEPTELM